MHCGLDLTKLHDAAQYRLMRIKFRYTSTSRLPREDHGLVISYVVLELDNLIISTLRQFTISSLRRARTVRGHRVSVNHDFGPEGEIGAYVLSILNTAKYNRHKPITIKREDEPTVRNPKETEKILMSCGASNLPSLQKALALNATVFRDIATVRNFYAHRNENTSTKVRNQARNIGIPVIRHPDELVKGVIIGRPVSVFEDWLTDTQLFFEELMK